MSDPTLQSLAQFNDPSKWVVVPNVPVFREHVSTLPDGKAIPIDQAELTKFAAEMQRLEQREGVLARLTLGHTLGKDPRTGAEPKETDQPPLVGFARNAHVGLYGKSQAPAVLIDYWLRRDDVQKYDIGNQFPYRSPEVYLASRQITGVALLKRDPKLDMGMTIFQNPNHPAPTLAQPKAYYRRADECQFYALDDESTEYRNMAEQTQYGGLSNTAGVLGGAAAGRALGTAALTPFLGPAAAPVAGLAGGVLGNKLTEDARCMADDKPPDGAAPAAPAPASAPDATPAPGADDGLEAISDQLGQMSPEQFQQLLATLTEAYQQAHGPAAAAPAAAPAGPPAAMHRGEPMNHYARENQALQTRLEKLEKYAGQLEHDKIVAQRGDQLRGLDNDGFSVVQRDYEKATRYNRELWDEHVQSIREDRQRSHANDTLLQIAAEGADQGLPDEKQPRTNYERGQESQASTERFDKVMEYMRKNECQFPEADAAFDKNGRPVKKTA